MPNIGGSISVMASQINNGASRAKSYSDVCYSELSQSSNETKINEEKMNANPVRILESEKITKK